MQRWKTPHARTPGRQDARTPAVTQALVPSACPPGETCQFDGSHEEVELGGVVQTIKVAHFRLTDSRQRLVVASPRETPERVLAGPVRAFALAPQRVVDDHRKTVVDTLARIGHLTAVS
jgi:transposase